MQRIHVRVNQSARLASITGRRILAPGRLRRNPGRSDEEFLLSTISHIVLNQGESIRTETRARSSAGLPAERTAAKRKQGRRSGKRSGI